MNKNITAQSSKNLLNCVILFLINLLSTFLSCVIYIFILKIP
ncbi:hypothetical protein ROSINTL182_05914 [Roseburia intestinalis L1-82]|uniref:Uncharacterized protein n=1 Tax=Roseburia intestinalis L1-82 TaxID=536231 RepID=C7G7N9_9FIRM|nr:hypothetical protein ROSINTL182_05914 [Roseburia intestinalis L1-82]